MWRSLPICAPGTLCPPVLRVRSLLFPRNQISFIPQVFEPLPLGETPVVYYRKNGIALLVFFARSLEGFPQTGNKWLV